MYNTDTETLYPFRVTSHLKKYRSQLWKEIIDQVLDNNTSEEEKIGFSMMMVKLGGCVTCSADSFRAMRGCTHCAGQTVRRFRGTDEEIKKLYLENVAEVKTYLEKNKVIISEENNGIK
jgi:hypothetical protein